MIFFFFSQPAAPRPAAPATIVGPPAATGTSQTASQDSFLSAEMREKALKELTDMGFERTQAELALRASFYHVERAADYLLSVKRRKGK